MDDTVDRDGEKADEQAVEQFAGWVFDRFLGGMETLSIHIGSSLGLYAALRMRRPRRLSSPRGRASIGGTPEEERDAWVRWVDKVFMPANREIYELIGTKTHLLDDAFMPRELLDFVAHVAGYEVTLAAWAAKDYSQLTSMVAHPGDAFVDYLRVSFSRLKSRQTRLLGRHP